MSDDIGEQIGTMGNVGDVEAVNRHEGIALLASGETIPITNWYCFGDECDPTDAVCCVAGPSANGKWYSIDLRQFQGGAIQ